MSSISAPAGGFDTGTAVLFAQTAAPVGWTKSTAHNNKALRVVSGTASSGGSQAFTTAFASQSVSGSVGNRSLSTAQLAAHTHQDNTTNQTLDTTLSAANRGQHSGTKGTTTSAGSGSSHNHAFTGTAIDLAVQYVDVIIATKD